jgi:hypothetical protein
MKGWFRKFKGKEYVHTKLFEQHGNVQRKSRLLIKTVFKPGVVVQACHSSHWEAEGD